MAIETKKVFTTLELDEMESQYQAAYGKDKKVFTTEELDQIEQDFKVQTNEISTPKDVKTWREPPQNEVVGPKTKTVIRHGWDPEQKPQRVSPRIEKYYMNALNDQRIPLEEIALNMRKMAREDGTMLGAAPFNFQEARAYRNALRKGQKPSNQVGYRYLEGMMAQELDTGSQERAEQMAQEGDLSLMAEEGSLFNPMMFLETLRKDWTDAELAGGISMDMLREKFPDATPEELDQIHDDLAGIDLRRQRQEVGAELDRRDVNPIVRGGMGVVTGVSPIDIVPFGPKGMSLAGRAMNAGVVNQAFDVGLQAHDIAVGAQEEFSGEQNFTAVLAGLGFHAVMELGAAGVRAIVRRGANSRGSYVDVETSDGAFKRIYRGKDTDGEAKIEDIGPEDIDPEGTPFEGGEVPNFLKHPVKAKGYDGKPRKQRTPKGESESGVVAESGKGQSIKDTTKRVGELTADWTNAPKFHIVNNVDDLDPKLEAEITADGAENALGATLPDGSVLLMTDNIKTPEALDAVVFHEALGHAGLNQRYGAELKDLLEQMYTGNKNLQADVDAWKAKHNWQGEHYVAVEEVLAELSEAGTIDPSLWNIIKAYLSKLAREMGLTDGIYSDAEVREILRQGHERIVNGEQSIGSLPGTRYIRAWHTSQAKFDDFDDAYMGSGQGAQAFSWGHYFSTGETTRRQYFNEGNQRAEARAMEGRARAEPLLGEDGLPIIADDSAIGPTILKKHSEFPLTEILSATWTEVASPRHIVDKPGLGRKFMNSKIFSPEEARAMEEMARIGKEDFEAYITDKRRDHLKEAKRLFDEARKLDPNYAYPDTLFWNYGGLDLDKEISFSSLSPELQKITREIGHNLVKADLLVDISPHFFKRQGTDIDDSAYTYEVELPDEDWLDWDLPLSRQPKVVREAFTDLLNLEKRKVGINRLRTEAQDIQNDMDLLELRLIEAEEAGDLATADLLEDDLSDLELMLNEVESEIEDFIYYHDSIDNMSGEDLYYKLSEEVFHGDQKAASKALSERGIPGTAFIDGPHRGVDLDGIESWVDQQIAHIKEKAEIEKPAIERALRTLKKNLAEADDPDHIDWYNNQIARMERKRDNFDRRIEREIEEVERQAWRNQTRNFVAYDPNDVKIVNRFRTKDGVPDNEQYTDLREDSAYADETIEQRIPMYMKDTERTPSKLKLNPGKQKQRGMMGNVSGQRFKSKRAVHDVIHEAAELAPELKSVSFAEIDRRARELDIDLDTIAARNEGSLKPEEAHALGIALIQKSEQVERLSKIIAYGDPSESQIIKFQESFLEMAAIFEVYSKIANDAGRLLAAFKIAKQSSSNEKLRFMAEDSGQIMNLPPGAEGNSQIMKNLAKEIADGKRKPAKVVDAEFTTMDTVANVLNIPRTLMSSIDLSAPLRQGVVFSTTRQFWNSFFKMFHFVGSKRAFDGLAQEMLNHPNFIKAREAGLSLTTTEGSRLSAREEDFQSEIVKKIPVIGEGVKMSERAFVGFLNKLRWDLFNKYLRDAERAGLDINDPKFLKDLGSFINAGTGRGPMPKKIAGAAPMLNSLFFSPRLQTSRMALLNPLYVGMMHPFVRKQYFRNMIGFASLAMTSMGLLAMNGADVETDPRSSDFGKIRYGTKRYDPLGGFGQYITFGARMLMDETKTAKGDIKELDPDALWGSRADLMVRFVRSKTSPVTSFLWDWADEQNVIGERFSMTEPFYGEPPEGEEPITWNKNAIVSRLTPLFLQDVFDEIQESGIDSVWTMFPVLFGIGHSNYDRVPSESPLKEWNNPDNPGVKELVRLTSALKKEPFGNATRHLNLDGKGKKKLTDEQFARYNEIADEIILQDVNEFIKQEIYSAANDKEKAELIREVVNNARKDARGILAYELYGSQEEADEEEFSGEYQPVENGKQAIKEIFPEAYVTQNRRDPNSSLGRANPDSWHVQSAAAVDVRPIPGYTFMEAIEEIEASGKVLLEAIDETKNPSSYATGPHWHFVIGEPDNG